MSEPRDLQAELETWLKKYPRCSQQGCLSDDIEERYSLGCYAGRWCDPHWKTSGYRDEPASAFDPLDAGEEY